MLAAGHDGDDDGTCVYTYIHVYIHIYMMILVAESRLKKPVYCTIYA